MRNSAVLAVPTIKYTTSKKEVVPNVPWKLSGADQRFTTGPAITKPAPGPDPPHPDIGTTQVARIRFCPSTDSPEATSWR